MTRKPPFELDLTRRNTLAAQMEDALRQSIASGRYHPGDPLPTVREWAKMLGVSSRVPKAVIRRLALEGLVVARPRHGCIVAPQESLSFRGHVLAVMPPEAHFGNSNVTCASMFRRLEDAGYLVTSVRVRRGHGERHDFRSLRLALRQSVDVAVFLYRDVASAQCARDLGVPFVTIQEGFLAGGVGHVTVSASAALEKMALDLRGRGIHGIGMVCKRERTVEYGEADVFRRAGLKVRRIPVGVDSSMPPEVRIASIMRGARDSFEKFLFSARSLPDALYFTDDFMVQGAVPVMLLHGVKVPDDVELSSITQYGRGPVFPFPMGRIEFNPYEDGKIIADGILSYFDKGAFPAGVVLSPSYVPA